MKDGIWRRIASRIMAGWAKNTSNGKRDRLHRQMQSQVSALSERLKAVEDQFSVDRPREPMRRVIAHHMQRLQHNLELDAIAGRRAVELLKLLAPKDAVGASYVRLGRDHDGGYVLDNRILNGGVAYSLGISDDVSWDLDMANKGYEVFQYDHTIEGLPEHHERFHFHRIGICAAGDETENMQSIGRLLDENGHADRDDLVLKMDIEAAEWGALASASRETLAAFSQLVIEFHWFERAGDEAWFHLAKEALCNLATDFVPVHIHANNHFNILVVGGYPIPQLLEVTFVRKDMAEFAECSRTFPTDLDQPNHPGRPDLWLGTFEF